MPNDSAPVDRSDPPGHEEEEEGDHRVDAEAAPDGDGRPPSEGETSRWRRHRLLRLHPSPELHMPRRRRRGFRQLPYGQPGSWR